jgi:RimJ/RimL family protein N-acetyltransferase
VHKPNGDRHLDGIEVRQAKASDAASFLELWDALDTETEFMLFEPNERQATLDTQRANLENAFNSENVRIVVLSDSSNKILAGFCAGRRSSNFRDKHSLHIVIGIRQKYTGKQWGFKLLTELEKWAISVEVSRLELSVMVNNHNAIALYSKHGYQIEGTKKNGVFLHSGYVDEYIMAKLI